MKTQTSVTNLLSRTLRTGIPGALGLAFCLAGCADSKTPDSQTADPVPKPAPRIAQEQMAEPTTAQVNEVISEKEAPPIVSYPPLTVRPVTRTEVHPAIQTASLELEERLPQPDGEFASGTPEWDLSQIAYLMNESTTLTRNSSKLPETALMNQLADNQRRIVALATHAIAELHFRPEREQLFNAAVYALVEARIQLSLQGDEQALQNLYQDALLLNEQRPESVAATTAASAVVRVAEKLARMTDASSPWLPEYVRQAKLFARNFPAEEAHSTIQLLNAGELCEERRETQLAMECYLIIEQLFPETPFRNQTQTAVRRLSLVGSPFQLNGVTWTGTAYQFEHVQGTPTLVVFWSALSNTFQQDISAIRTLADQHGYAILGINLDLERDAVENFITQHDLPGQHLFHPDKQFRGSNQPIAVEFGIQSNPVYWLIDGTGIVRGTHENPAHLLKKKEQQTTAAN
ncbi:MAG: hypothetical protein KDA78_04760 [Planctomycetaceae bacterium]|nr:hypothetical protein [Planctomycetaceae bacterium]